MARSAGRRLVDSDPSQGRGPIPPAERGSTSEKACPTELQHGPFSAKSAGLLFGLWDNPEWRAVATCQEQSFRSWAVRPRVFRPTMKNEVFTAEISKTRGRPVRPAFYHHAGLLEYVWFSHRAAVPAILYDQTVRLLDSVSFTWHRDSSAIHLRQAGEVVGLFWPCDISAPEVLANARRQLNRRFGENTATGENRR